MVHPGECCSCVRRPIPWWCVALMIGFAGAIGAAAMPSSAAEEESLPAAASQIAVETPEPGGSTVPAAVTVVKDPEAGAEAEHKSDERRRVFMLLLMNSAGPVRPFGNLGR
jgi:hypothetical protein